MSKLPTYIRRARGITISFRNSVDTMRRIEKKLQKLQKKQKKEQQKREEQRRRKEREEAEWLEASIVCEAEAKKS
jgi:Sec-independent protein translocase protein TatA